MPYLTLLEKSLLFKEASFPAKTGITYSLAGDFSVWQDDKANEFSLNMRLARELTGDGHYHKLIADHGDQILDANSCGNWNHGDGLIDFDPSFPEKKRSGAALFSTTADCPTVVFCSDDQRLIAIVHSGWRGTKADIIPKALVKIKIDFKIDLSKVKAVIFPGICDGCYKVGEDVGSFFAESFQDGYLDLRGFIIRQMNPYLDQKNIHIVPYCSLHSADGDHRLFESYRFNRTAQRNLVFVARKT